MPSQDVFYSCYRGRQSALNHLAYMRTSKVIFAELLIHRNQLVLDQARIFDYGFGAGTFFLRCPRTAHLSGVETDSVAVSEVQNNLRQKGFAFCDLSTIDIENWHNHHALQSKYDLVLCSHVLEHMNEPVKLLTALANTLSGKDSRVIVLLPINERSDNPHHVQTVTRSVVTEWANSANLEVIDYEEGDPWRYWIQPIFTKDSGPAHVLARVVSIILGFTFAKIQPKTWFKLGSVWSYISLSKPMQCAVLLSKNED